MVISLESQETALHLFWFTMEKDYRVDFRENFGGVYLRNSQKSARYYSLLVASWFLRISSSIVSLHTRRRSDMKHLDLQIIHFSWIFFWVTDGDPFTIMKTSLKSWGLPRTRVWYVRGLLWKLVGNLGSRIYFKVRSHPPARIESAHYHSPLTTCY